MSTPNNITVEQVIAAMKQRFPHEYEICVQQAYIANLEAALAEHAEPAEESDD